MIFESFAGARRLRIGNGTEIMSDTKQIVDSKKRKGPVFWIITFVLILGVAVIATFFANGRSIAAEWTLLASQLGATAVLSVPVGFVIAKLSNGCIVCRDGVCTNANEGGKQ